MSKVRLQRQEMIQCEPGVPVLSSLPHSSLCPTTPSLLWRGSQQSLMVRIEKLCLSLSTAQDLSRTVPGSLEPLIISLWSLLLFHIFASIMKSLTLRHKNWSISGQNAKDKCCFCIYFTLRFTCNRHKNPSQDGGYFAKEMIQCDMISWCWSFEKTTYSLWWRRKPKRYMT